MRKDAKANNQAKRKLKEEALHFAGKYKEANDALAIRNIETTTLEKEKQKLKETKKDLER